MTGPRILSIDPVFPVIDPEPTPRDVVEELAWWFLVGNGPQPGEMFDDSMTWAEAVRAALGRDQGA